MLKLKYTADAKAHIIFWPIVIIGVTADLWTKYAVFKWLVTVPYNTFSIIDGIFQFVLAENEGAAFGIASGRRTMLVLVAVVALVIILGLFLFGEMKHRLMTIALAMFTAGICGNLYDRFFNDGRVRDFIDVVYWPGKHWPAFNIADSLLCVAVGLMFFSNFITSRKPSR